MVVLVNERTGGDSRLLEAHMSGGDLVVHGEDWGEKVRAFFNTDFYEFGWEVKGKHLPRMSKALGLTGGRPADLLSALQKAFESGQIDGVDFGTWLKRKRIPSEFWSRVDD